MRHAAKFTLLFLSGLVLTGCGMFEGGIPNDLDENWSGYMEDAENNLESYTTDIDLTAETDAMGQSVENRAKLVASVIGDFDKGHVIVINEQEGVEVSTEMYFVDSTYYVNEGNGWQEIPAQESGTADTDTSYKNVLNAIVESENFITAEVTGDELLLNYQGYDQEVWDAFELPFSLTIDGFQEEEIEMILEVIVDAETQLIEELELSVYAENELGTVSLLVEVQYDDYNEIDELEVEQEIEEEFNL